MSITTEEDRWTKWARETNAALDALAQSLQRDFQPGLERFAQAAKEFHDAVYAEYVKSGAIYGETDEGFRQWVREASARVRQHQALELRRAFAEGRAKLRAARQSGRLT